jgi:hypothetical protein
MRRARQTSQRWPRHSARAAVGLPAVLLAGLAVLVLAGCSTSKARTAAAPSSCNDAANLCERRLNEVVFPGTHNSMAASDEPGWYFANQRYGISRQLDDGIRALLIDVHFGVYDAATGRVRTDLGAEGSDRNKVAKLVPPAALRVADRVAGRVGVGTLSGKPGLYLCHTLCELGAPPPTLGALIARGQRLVVFAEEKGGTPAWYMPAFSFIQDTPLGATRPDQLSCKRYRGEKHSPLLLINHWIPPFPPSPSLNAAIGREAFLRARIKRCQAQDGAKGAIVAVDFYQRTSVVKVARELDGDGG